MIGGLIFGLAGFVISVLFYATLVIGYGHMPSYWALGLVAMFTLLCGRAGWGSIQGGGL